MDYTYNEMNLLTAADFNGIMASYTYNGNGHMTKKKVGNNETTISYNNYDLPTSYETKVGDKVLGSFKYTYSVDGNRISENDTVNNISKAYEYDGAGRLVKETQSGAENRISSFTYDLRGNRTKETVTGDENYVMTNTYDANNRLTNQSKTVDGSAAENVKYYYDANGNQTFKQTYNYSQGGLMSVKSGSYQSGTVESFTYNLQNQLTGYQSNKKKASYAYGADGLRKSKTVNNVMMKYVWDRGNLAAEVSGSTIVNMYDYGPDGITSKETSNGDKTLYLKNAHGDVVGMSDTNGNVSTNYRYDAFGNELSESIPDRFGYCGEFLDSESGLVYLRARYYDSKNGRFLSEDSYRNTENMIYDNVQTDKFLKQFSICVDSHEKSDKILASKRIDRIVQINNILQSSNLYLYCIGNPITHTDSSGNGFTVEWAGSMWWAVGVDGVLPVGDIIYVAGLGACVIIDGVIIFSRASKSSDKDRSTDIPSWAKGEKPREGESGKEYAKRLCDERYGKGNYRTGPGSEYNKLRKYGDRYQK